ncbi:transcriptional repressor LexA [Luteimonas kalidii]|uniref:LexA repressor n=1 Tax=Luteimonas kalidii TaxID=3042025 RepID=A0ABT6JXA3_9GAMM|nr:transcriptional repressor LexA [Luteimonas kalidii]MDH5835325.1 transcriptional repressor LexA [Luteimonas kalidii]
MSLTPRQQQVLNHLRQQIDATGLPPTIHELMEAFGWASPNAAAKHLDALIGAGAIEMAANKARTIQLVGTRKRPDTLELPLVGRVAAGEPILSEGLVERIVAVDRWMFRPKPDFLLRVEGDSMIDDGVLDGDLVAGKATPDAEHGQTVIARVGEGITIKRLYRRGRVLRLLPRNPAHVPIDPDPTEDFAIEGVYCGLLRRP